MTQPYNLTTQFCPGPSRGPSIKSSFQLNENTWAGLRSEAAKRPLGARPQQRNLNFKFWNYKFYCYAFA